MKLVPVVITEEILGDENEFNIVSDGLLDLDSGDITVKNYFLVKSDVDNEDVSIYQEDKDSEGNTIYKTQYDVQKDGYPASHPEYAFSTGLLKIGTKELEFAVNFDSSNSLYEVNADELEQIKEKALNLANGGTAAKVKSAKTSKSKKNKY